ncbi:ornithine transporter [Fusarium bulbicola]|nr:ornithine transporter [Fusarium bulbicola]
MSADFWAGYLSGAVGIIIGNPLDVIKVRLQAQYTSPVTNPPVCSIPTGTTAAASTINQGASFSTRYLGSYASLVTGTAAPILGYGALNALLFVSYNRTEAALNGVFSTSGNLWNTWLAGAVGGLATWVVSTPTELIKCRAQLASSPISSWAITKDIWKNEGTRGLYFGGTVTAIRDSVGYGFYFWSYELTTRWLAAEQGEETSLQHEAAKVLLCGGLAGVATWASIFPLDVVKTRVQAQTLGGQAETTPLLRPNVASQTKRAGAIQVAREAYREGGSRVFFRGLTVCSVRAFIVNAVQWAVYEWVMFELGHGRKKRVANEPRVELVQT